MPDDFMLTTEERRQKRARRRLLVLISVGAIFLLIGGYFAARPTRNAIKAWQARRHADKAFALIEQEKWNDARTEAVAAFQLQPTEPEALRAVARFLSRTRQQQALEFWDRLAEQTPLTPSDRRDEALVALATGETARAASVLAPLLEGEGKDATPADWLLAAQIRLQQGVPEPALAAAERVLAHPRATRREQLQATLLRAQILAHTSPPDASGKLQADTMARLEKFAQSDDETALDALVLLTRQALTPPATSSPDSTPAEPPLPASSADLIHRLEQHPLAGPAQKLLAVDLRIAQHPEERDALIAGAIEHWKNADADTLALLATWLNGRREFERTLSEIPLDKALTSRALFLQHVDALGALGRWAEIKRLLESERYPLDPFMQRMYLARCNAQLGEQAAAENNWRRALESAGGDPGNLITLAEYAEKNGAREIAASAYEAAAASAPKLRHAQQGRLRLAQTARDTQRMHAILAEMLRHWPNDLAIQNDEAYTRLLLLGGGAGEKSKDDAHGSETKTESLSVDKAAALQEIARLAESLVEREPSSLPHRTLLALARLQLQRPAEALEVYQDIQVSPNALSGSALAVHAAVLAATGNQADAKTEIAQIPLDALLPEERALVESLTEEKPPAPAPGLM